MTKQVIKIFIFILSILFVYSLAYADEAGRFVSLEGRVDMLKSGEVKTMPVREGGVVSSGDIIRTKSLSKAEIKFDDGTVLKLAESTRVEIKEYVLDESGLRTDAIIDLQRGEIRTLVSKSKGAPNFFVNTPNASGSVKGSDVFIFFQKSATGVLVNEGNFSVVNNAFPGQTIDVSEGFTTIIPSDHPPQKPRPYLDVELRRHEAQTAVFRVPVKEDPSQIKGVVVKLSGEVKIKRIGETRWNTVTLHDVINAGDQIETEESGMVEIRLDNGNIITLKPKSTIIFTKLIWDLKTGDYENLFVVNIGRIRAKIERLKGDSKFEIRTPTAVAGARGTWMYLEVLPGLTRVFFEGGDGTLTSLISQISKVVGDGQTSSADDQGNVSDSTDATDEERSQWSTGWDPGETQGYSPPEGGAGEFVDYEEDEGEAGEALDTPDIGDTDGEPTVDVPPESEADTTTPTFSGLTATFDGEYYTSLEKDTKSSVSAIVTSDGTFLSDPPEDDDPENFRTATVSGTYSNPNVHKTWLSDVAGQDTSGSTFLGWIGGIWASWEGLLVGLYIDSSDQAGIIAGDFSGTNDATTFSGDGELNFEAIVETEVLPAELANSVTDSDPDPGRFWSVFGDEEGSPGYIIGDVDRAYKNITGESWGIYKDVFSADYYNPDSVTEFTGVLQGYNDDGLFVSLLKGEDSSNGSIEMSMVGPYINYDRAEVYVGSLLGTYTEGNSYYSEAVGLGVFVEEELDEPLAFVGFWGQDIETLNGNSGDGSYALAVGSSLYYNDSGDISQAGEECGVISGETSPWSGETEFSAAGYYYDWEREPYVWNTPIYTYNPQQDNYTTQDGGAFYGWTTGIWDNEDMDGYLVALYLSPTPTEGVYDAGFLTGDVEGEYYPALYMWTADGTLTPELVETDLTIDPALLDEAPYKDDIQNGELSGDFNGVGSIEGEMAQGHTLSIYEDSSWGICDIKFGDRNTYSNPDPTTYTTWQAVAGGVDDGGEDHTSFWLVDIEEGTWQNNHITADVTGNFLSDENLGTIEGKFYGVNNGTNGTWIGASIGTWQEEPLTSSGRFDSSFKHFGEEDGYFEGLVGLTGSMWGDGETPYFASIGEFDSKVGEPFIWFSEGDSLYSYDPDNDTYTTYDGGAFYGMAGGAGDENEMEGMLYALYIDPDENAGIFSGQINGFYSNDIEMYLLEGGLTNTVMADDMEMPPQALIDNLYFSEIEGSGLGGFGGGGDIEADLEGVGIDIDIIDIDIEEGLHHDWGIWGAMMDGTWSEPTSPWRLALGGTSEEQDDGEDCWFGTVDGTEWADNRLAGEFRGFWFAPVERGRGRGRGRKIRAGKITGDVVGTYIDVPDGTDTWQSIGIGEWVEVTDLLKKGKNHLGFDMEDLEDFVSVPITETYTNLLTGVGGFDAGGAIQGIMDISIYDNEIWAALISGTYSGPTGDSWDLQLSDGPDVTNLTGDLWSDGEWHAAVDGVVNDMSITGEAAGTYADGNFEGLGAGVIK